MCDPVDHKRTGWPGWPELTAPRLSGSSAPWIDLSHPITEDFSRVPFFPQPRIRRLMTMPDDPLNLTEIHMVCHHGTHIDAPCHFIADGPAIDAIPLERLYGQGVVWPIELEPLGVIEPHHFEAATPAMEPGDIVLLDTGWARHANTEHYEDHPSLSPEAARWLVDHGAKLVGVDFSTPDLAAKHRAPGFDWPVHHVLLGGGTLVAEHVTNLAALRGRRVDVMVLAINLAGSDGAPARIVARPSED